MGIYEMKVTLAMSRTLRFKGQTIKVKHVLVSDIIQRVEVLDNTI